MHSVGVSDDTIDVLVRQPPVVFNKAAHARPVMSSISCLTDRVATQEQASLTEAPITRSQASQASEEKRYTVEHGVSTDEPPTRVHRATDTEQQHTAQSSFGVQTPADLLDKFVSREAVEQANRILEEQWAHYRNGLVSTAVSTLPTPRLITVGVSTLLDKGNMISQAVDATDSNLLLSLFDRNIREYEGLRLNRQVAKAAQTTRSNAVNSLNSV
ncbi:unnamed protein product [Protopolystoma xenopodis]|uniref:Uncharacterized protein n=1 Tax=Protopolystoma xenopodis TaxID=117903 RepID=A0A3S5AKW0_9PLAT|nr:unnamed protein product [Protopolystoma xenopodis]